MDERRIAIAKRTAKEFIDSIDEMEAEEKQRLSADGKYHYDSPKHRGAVRRKSMDLTRALADMRRP